ncbi:MAG TPA: Ig-like domain repeat protein [Methylomirabilota bacterium]|nr:Ig-like domain repeat protein [Methylomirabilota bacterium]
MKQVQSNSRILAASLLALSLAAMVLSSGCTGGSAPPPPPISVSLSPSTAQSVDQGQSIKFTATVSNDSVNKGVSWALMQNNSACSPGCGTISPASTPSGQPATYSAPTAINANLQFNVVATSVADTTKSASDQTTAVPPPALNNPGTLPTATVGQAYSFQLTEVGGVSPFTWSITSGSLPAGLSLNSSTGLISGTPTAAVVAAAKVASPSQPLVINTSNITIQVIDSGSPQLKASQVLAFAVSGKASTSTALTSSANPSSSGQNVTFTATVSSASPGTPTGTVTFLDGATSLGTSTLNASAQATFSTSSLSLGSHSITAQYGGDANFSSSTSSALAQVVNSVPDFSLSASPSTLTLAPGASGTATITVNPVNGFNGSVSFAASGLPNGVSPSFSPIANNSSTLTLSASATAATGTVTVTVTGTSGGLTHNVSLSLTVIPKSVPACSASSVGGPSITTQPTAQTVTLTNSPQTATFSVSATSGNGSTLSYQWYVGAQPSVTGSSPIPGATSPTYTTPTLTGAFNGLFYSVQVNNSVCSMSSQPAFLAVNEPNDSGAIQIPTIQQQARFSLTQSGGAQFLACSGTSPIGGNNPTCTQGAPAVDWVIYENGVPCPSGCGSVVPASSPSASGASGATTTYIAPTGLPLAGKTFTLVATNHDHVNHPNDFATTEIVVTPCTIGDPMCGEFTFLVQGFDANGRPANTAGHFTATGLVNGSTMITDGVIDINDSDGIDAGVPITSGSYTFDRDSNGNLLPNLNSLTGTLTLNIASTLTPPKSHAQRTYAFTAISFGAQVGKASLIEFDPAQIGTPPAANPAAGFQGSGSLWQVGSPGPYAFATGCTANPSNTPPSKCNYAFGLQGAGSGGTLGMVGAFNVNVDSNNNCKVTSNISPAGNPTVVRNEPGVNLVPQQGNLFGSCGALSTVNVNGLAVTEADDANGRGTAQLCFLCSAATPPTDTFAYYVVPRAGVIFVDMTTPGVTLSGLAHPSVTTTSPMNTLGCGTLIELGQVANCVTYTSGDSQNNGTTGSNGSDVTLTLARLTCPTLNDGGASCKEPLPPIPNNTLTGNLAVTLDQVTGGLCNGKMVSNIQPCGSSTSAAGSYSIETTTGVGTICLHAAPCPASPNSIDTNALTYVDGFLLANDKTAALGSLQTQVFSCTTPCITPQPFGNGNPGPFVAASIPSFQSAPPNVNGSFDLKAPAGSPCPGTPPVDNFDSDALYASGAQPLPGFLVSLPSASPSVSGCYAFDTPASPLTTGRGTGTSTMPGPASFIFYDGSLNGLPLVETDNAIPGGQVLLTLTPQNASVEITSTTTNTNTNNVTFQANKAPNCNPTPANPLLNCFTITATGLSQLTVGGPFVSPNLCVQPKGATSPFSCPAPGGTSPLPNGVTFVANTDASGNPNGTATISGMPAPDSGSNCDLIAKVCTYVLTITATQTIQEPSGPPLTGSQSQTFVLAVNQ